MISAVLHASLRTFYRNFRPVKHILVIKCRKTNSRTEKVHAIQLFDLIEAMLTSVATVQDTKGTE